MGPPSADLVALVDRLPLVDHHCHPLRHRPPEDAPALRACFSESHEARLLRDHAGTSLFYRRAVRDLGAFYGVKGEAALVAREAGVQLLALVHLSTRYFGHQVVEEARELFPDTVVPRDFDTVEIPFAERGAPALVRAGARARKAALGSEST